MTKINESDILKMLAFIADNDLHDYVGWRCDAEYAPVTFWVNCSDLMAWGCSDCEDIGVENLTELKWAMDDCESSLKYHSHYGVSLFVCRARKERPQGAAYPISKELWSLFDECGPERVTGMCNPYKPGQRKSSVPYDFACKLEKICRDFLVENKISEDETIYQCDWVIENASGFIEKIFNAYVDGNQLPPELIEEIE